MLTVLQATPFQRNKELDFGTLLPNAQKPLTLEVTNHWTRGNYR